MHREGILLHVDALFCHAAISLNGLVSEERFLTNLRIVESGH